MASVFERNGRWYLRWRDASGAWVQKVSTARNKTEARRTAGELERRDERRRLGLEDSPAADGGGTLGTLLERWLVAREGQPNQEREAYSVRKHLLGHTMAQTTLARLKPSDLETFLAEKTSEGLAPATVNQLRSFISRALGLARRRGWFIGPSPVAGVQKLRVHRRLAPRGLSETEVPAVLAELSDQWRPLFACAFYAALRKGELLALTKADVDLERQRLVVARSGERETTKGGHADVVPIHDELLPHLRAAMERSPSELVFPHVCSGGCLARRRCSGPGGRMPADVDLEGVLRRAMGRAGIVTGYLHVCRSRKGAPCTHQEMATDAEPRRCPVHGRLLWAKPQVRHVRFHDTRHTAATLLLRAGAPIHAVQKVLRHRDPNLTIGTYGHLSEDWVLGEIHRLSLPLAASLLPSSGPEEASEATGEKVVIFPRASERLRQDSNLLPPASKAGALSR